MNGNGDTLDLTRIRMTAAQVVAFLVLIGSLIGTGAVAINTLQTMTNSLELTLKTVAMHSVELAVLDNEVKQLKDDIHRQRNAARARRYTSPEDDTP